MMDMNMAIKVGAIMQSCLKPVSTLKGDVTKLPLPSTVDVTPILSSCKIFKYWSGHPNLKRAHQRAVLFTESNSL